MRRRQVPTAIRWGVVALGALAALMAVAHWPVTTRVGIDYQVSTKRVPLYQKVIDFASRDLQTRRLVREVIAGSSSQEEKLLRIFAWVTEHVRPVPEGFPVVDDHPFHIILRGYGAEDQRVEAFALLAGYAGLPTQVARARPTGIRRGLMLAVVQCDTRVVIVDVVNRVVFRTAGGGLAELSQVLEAPEAMARASRVRTIEGVAYWRYLQALQGHSKLFSRTQRQKFWPRLWGEFQGLMGMRNG